MALRDGNANEARKRFEAALKTHKGSVTARIGKGEILFRAKRYKDALGLFREAKNLDPQSVPATLMVARTVMAQGEPKKALQTLNALRRIAPGSPELMFLLGQVQQMLGQYEVAEGHYKQAIKLRKVYFKPYLYLSRLHLKLKAPDKALKVLDEADKAIPKSGRVANAKGEVHLANKKLKKARKAFALALKLDPKLNVAIFNLGSAYFQLGKVPKAKEQFLLLQEKDQQYPNLAANLGRIYMALKDPANAAKQYDLALKVDNPVALLRLAGAKAYIMNKQYDKALAQTDGALRVDSTIIADARALRAEALLAKGKPDKALDEITQSVAREANRADFQVIKGKVLEALKRNRDAMDAFSAALKQDPSLSEIRERLGILMVKAHMAEDGLKIIRQVLKKNRNRGDLYMYAGVAYLDLDKEAMAEKAFKKSLTLDQTLGLAHYRLGMMMVDKRSWSGAYTRLKTALKHVKKTDEWHADAYYRLGLSAESLKKKKPEIVGYFNKFLELASPGDGLREDAQNRRYKAGWRPKKEEGLP